VNHNVDWLNFPGTWSAYIAVLLLAFAVCCTFANLPHAATAVNVLHFALTFYLLHWKKGTPIPYGDVAHDPGLYDRYTFWEQMDEGVQLTRNRKFFTAVPVALFFASAPAPGFFLLNLSLAVVLIVAKLPFMHRCACLTRTKCVSAHQSPDSNSLRASQSSHLWHQQHIMLIDLLFALM
jgi:hypothetical protein